MFILDIFNTLKITVETVFFLKIQLIDDKQHIHAFQYYLFEITKLN